MDVPEATRVVLSYPTRVVLSYPEGPSDWGRGQVEADRYRGYFARVMDRAAVGDVREEFVDVGWRVQSAAGPSGAAAGPE